MAVPAAQSGGSTNREPRWPAIITIFAAVAMHFALPESMREGPPWIGAIVITVLVIAAHWAGVAGRHTLNRRLGFLLAIALTSAVIYGVSQLVLSVITRSQPPVVILRAAVILWAVNVITFAVWYWRLDGGGPMERDDRDHAHTDAFLFPQMMLPHDGAHGAWRPHFIDYLFLSFNTSTAFSPTDVPVLTRWAKLLMMTQSVIALTTVIVLVARAINTL
jgi:hypothetical protein